jgi:polyhydroxyalkanoate synthesis regulator phasin
MDIREKAAFLKGLIEGSDLQMGAKEKKILDSLVELMSDMAQQLTECDDDLTELYDEVDELEEEVLDI